ncbi:MAG: HD-GYP domain-containing protein [Dehalococcoidia bacterium]
MVSRAPISTPRPEYVDPTLFEEAGPGGLPRLTRGALLAPLSRAFDLAEGRKPGHAQRVAYIALAVAQSLKLRDAQVEEVYFAALLHDIGMASMPAAPTPAPGLSANFLAGGPSSRTIRTARPSGGWGQLLAALNVHCENGATIARRLSLSEGVAQAVLAHHDTWDQATGRKPSVIARIVAAADRMESMLDADLSPLAVRRRGPQLMREMSGSELDPDIADRLAKLASADPFWIGFYDNDLTSTLMTMNIGAPLDRESFLDVLTVVADVVDARNGRERGRGRRVAEMARKMGAACELSDRRADLIMAAALLQDIGTLGVSTQVLSKPDILSIEELGLVQQHPVHAREVLSEIPGLGAAAWWVGCHHERVDGKGYPGMLQGTEVPMEAQIIGMAEAYDALTSDRPYRRAMDATDAVAVMRGLSGTRFDGTLVERFIAKVDLLQR